jgi:LysM repeat protein
MKKIAIVLFLIGMFFVATSNVFSADYTVKEGNVLRNVARHLDHTMGEIQKINALCSPDRIYAGQVLTYVGNKDIGNAVNWCIKMLGEFSPGEEGYNYYWNTALEIQDGAIGYDPDDCQKVHYSTVLLYSTQWSEWRKK